MASRVKSKTEISCKIFKSSCALVFASRLNVFEWDASVVGREHFKAQAQNAAGWSQQGRQSFCSNDHFADPFNLAAHRRRKHRSFDEGRLGGDERDHPSADTRRISRWPLSCHFWCGVALADLCLKEKRFSIRFQNNLVQRIRIIFESWRSKLGSYPRNLARRKWILLYEDDPTTMPCRRDPYTEYGESASRFYQGREDGNDRRIVRDGTRVWTMGHVLCLILKCGLHHYCSIVGCANPMPNKGKGKRNLVVSKGGTAGRPGWRWHGQRSAAILATTLVSRASSLFLKSLLEHHRFFLQDLLSAWWGKLKSSSSCRFLGARFVHGIDVSRLSLIPD